jgi:hypothetical protein
MGNGTISNVSNNKAHLNRNGINKRGNAVRLFLPTGQNSPLPLMLLARRCLTALLTIRPNTCEYIYNLI